MANKVHKLMGETRHGWYEVYLRGPAEGFLLTKVQSQKVNRARCGRRGCACGGFGTQVQIGGYAWVEWSEANGGWQLIPG